MPFTMPSDPAVPYTDQTSITALLGAAGLAARLDDGITSAGGVASVAATVPVTVTTTAAHGLSTGNSVMLFGSGGANGTWKIIVVDSTSFTLTGSQSIGSAFTGVGAWLATGSDNSLVASAVGVGTAKVNRYCQPLYETSDLAQSWSVWNWATIFAAHWVCCRRANPIPNSLMNNYLEALDECKAVKTMEFPIEDIGYRNDIMPLWAALRIDQRYSVKKLRVENSLSSRVAPQFPRKVDFPGSIIGSVEPNFSGSGG